MINTNESKKVLFRLKAQMKQDFSVALVKAGVGGQHILEAFVEKIIAHAGDETLAKHDQRALRDIFIRANELQAEAKNACV